MAVGKLCFFLGGNQKNIRNEMYNICIHGLIFGGEFAHNNEWFETFLLLSTTTWG